MHIVPDSSRPTSSRFFQISKSYLTFDNSAKRVTSHPGGKNIPTIFAYLTSKIFEIIVLTVNNHNKIGKLAFDKTDGNWQSPHSFLSHMEWSANQFTENIIADIFNSFVQDKVMKSRSDPKLEFSLIKDLEFPSEAQISEARLSNVYLMNIIDDLTKFLPQTLETGKPSHNRNTMLYAPLWEAYFADSIHDAYKDEMIIKTNEFITKMNFTEKLTFIQIGTGAGFGTIEIMELLLDKLRDIEIQVNYVEQISYLMGKAREQMTHHLSEKNKIYKEKNIIVSPIFETQSLSQLNTFQPHSTNIVFVFQILQFVGDRKLINFFEQVSKVLASDGTLVLLQPTSYSKEFPFPLTLLFHSVADFQGFPTVDQVKSAAKSFFNHIQVSAMDTVWIMKNPIHY